MDKAMDDEDVGFATAIRLTGDGTKLSCREICMLPSFGLQYRDPDR